MRLYGNVINMFYVFFQRKKMFNGWHFLQSILQIIQTTMGMFLMLIFMTFNVWLAFSVSLGSGVGYFLFSWNKQSLDPLDEDHCG